MFREIFLFELRYWLKQKTTYISFGIFVLLSFAIAAASTGLFESMTATTDHGKSLINSPLAILGFVSQLCQYAYFVLPSIIGASIYRDFQSNMHGIFFTLPVSKQGYLGGRFLGSFVITVFLFSGIAIGHLVALSMPWVNPDFLGPFSIAAYLHTYLFYVIPDLILFSALVFSVTMLSRNISAGFILVIVLFLLNSLLGDFKPTSTINTWRDFWILTGQMPFRMSPSTGR